MKKRKIVISCLILMALCSCNNQEQQSNQNNILSPKKLSSDYNLLKTDNNSTSTYVDLDNEIITAASLSLSQSSPWNKIGLELDVNGLDSSSLTVSNVLVTEIDEPTIGDGETIYIGNATLENSTNTSQTMNSQSFTKSITESLATSITNGIKTSTSISASFEPAEILKFSSSITTEISFSETSTNKESTSVSYTAPEQSITIPANTTAKVSVYLKTIKANGRLMLEADFSGKVTYDKKGTELKIKNIYEMFENSLNYGYSFPNSLSLDNEKETVHFEGTGEYQATYGTEYLVKVEFTNDNNSNLLKSTKFIEVPVE
ncbi:ETX/MTX2 family pore-forming toxin [Bacillus carboniphilus]|uniref:ETX/MTX2 family pore-forming toxin n=1 Tax=Bacillus carboniphilus TaxID=86663 RepID=A0ABY9JTP0_9BACI|nr:ETX/MTX2 family pore-forming toxin [Bacillus carboniphilus]WLR42761.1 ETX/MTX2 family pore-forming toxin [Bacillus carboniphilus]